MPPDRPLALASMLLAAACGGSLEPGDVAGRYRLTTVDAGRLPSLVYATVECDDHITEGTLTLSADGRYGLAYTTALDCRRAGPGEVVTTEHAFAGVFYFEGRHIHLAGMERRIPAASLEGDARGDGFVILAPRPTAEPQPALELGFEPVR
jgi:hypothetical protein